MTSKNINTNLDDLGYKGNLGSRSKFQFNSTDYYLMEAQIEKNEWGTWRIVITRGNTTPLRQLNLKLPDEFKDDTGFANPKITKLKKPDGT